MVPAYLSEPPAPKKAAGKAAKAEKPPNSLVPKADKALDEAYNIQLSGEPHTTTDSETVRKTWERGTTNNAMVPAYLSEPPKPKEDAKPVSLGKKSPSRKGASAAPPKASDTVEGEELNIQLNGDRIPVEETWVRGTTNASMVDETPAPRVGTGKAAKLPANPPPASDPAKPAPAKEAAPAEAKPDASAGVMLEDN
jgi:hypothetical protein